MGGGARRRLSLLSVLLHVPPRQPPRAPARAPARDFTHSRVKSLVKYLFIFLRAQNAHRVLRTKLQWPVQLSTEEIPVLMVSRFARPQNYRARRGSKLAGASMCLTCLVLSMHCG